MLAEKMLKAKGLLRRHPGWPDEQVAAAAGIHTLDIDQTVAVARQELINEGVLPGVQTGDEGIR